MVGEVSPDGKFMWNGQEWVPRIESIQDQQLISGDTNNSPSLSQQETTSEIPLNHFAEKTSDKGKEKTIALSIVGILILSALGWVLYAFVIDPMLFPEPYSESKFVSVVDEQPTEEEIIYGEVDSWICSIEMKIIEDGMTIRTNFDIYTSGNSARLYSKYTIALFGSFDSDIWIDENQIAWKMTDGENVTKNKVSVSGFDTSPVEEILNDSSTPSELCFIHHAMVEKMEENPSQKFSSEKERFPDEEGVRAIKVETMMEIEDGDEDMKIEVFFDGDDNMLGTKISNSSLDCLITYSSETVKKPNWVDSVVTEGPMLLDTGLNEIYWGAEKVTIDSQFNATYSMENVQVVVYNGADEILEEVQIQDVLNQETTIQVMDDRNEVQNCTILYNDTDDDMLISTGDELSIDCDGNIFDYRFLGLADENGIAEKVDMDALPWISPIMLAFTILAAALMISARD